MYGTLVNGRAASAILLGVALCASAAVRINEIAPATSSHLTQQVSGWPVQVGAGVPWQMPAFNDAAWTPGNGPFGFGAAFATNIAPDMQNRAVSFYVRTVFTAGTAVVSSSNAIVLNCDFDDGFVAYLNGREVARKNLGAYGSFVFCDQASFNVHPMGTNLALTLGAASNVLVTGTNVFCVQVHNETLDSADFGWTGALDATDGTNTQAVLSASADAKYWIGVGEPSGGLNLSASGAVHVVTGREWAERGFDDGGWQEGPGGIGFGDGDDATDIYTQMYNNAAAVYLRQRFTVDVTTATSSNALRFTVNYDDGYVAYLNGIEVSRAGIGAPGEFTPYTAFAASHEAGATVTNTIGVCSNLLVAGTNVLAIQVHNNSLTSSDLSMIANLFAVGAATNPLVRHTNLWRYFVAEEAPVPEPDQDTAGGSMEFADWIELHNDATTAVSVAGWALTDDGKTTNRWTFPAGATIGPRGYLLVLCSATAGRTGGPPYVVPFELAAEGEFLGLYNSAGAFVSGFTNGYPEMSYFHSYGWSTNRATNLYWSLPTPGAANAGPVYTNVVPAPDFEQPAGFYTNNLTVTLTNELAGATIRYTLNGAEPQTNTGALYAPTGIALTTGVVIRARAFRDGWVPSRTVTHTYLVNVPAALRTLPVVSIAGDPTQGLFKSNGITSIVGGQWVSNIWRAVTADDFNIPVKYGRPYERPVSIEFAETGETGKVYRADCGLRIAGSAYTRPRYQLQNMSGTWYGSAEVQKPQFNVFFRGDYGESEFEFPFIPGSRVDQFDALRLRGGHNDVSNPFIRDELARRLYFDMGQVSSRGRMASLFVNGIFRCYYNPTERLEQRFFQEWHRSTNEWDIINHAGLANGDTTNWNALISLSKTLDASILTNYQRLAAMVDPVAFTDYILVNTYGATWDWPQNNFYAARERSSNGLFRFYVWDAEGAFSTTAGKTNGYDTIGKDLLYKTNINIGAIFTGLYRSPEYRLLFADRFQKHVLRGPALTASNVLARAFELKSELDPVMFHVRNAYVNLSIITNWVQVRDGYMVTHLRQYGLLPTLSAPDFTVPGGAVTNGFPVTLANTNGRGLIFYALDGADPRAPGGAIAGTLYTGPIFIDRSRQIRARCFDGTTWSAAAEEAYLSTQPPLVISEIMYSPEPGGAEFVELFNAGTSPIDLSGFHFDEGIVFDFAGSSVTNLAAGEYCVIVQNRAQFTNRYTNASIRIAGVYTGSLNNNGEDLELVHDAFGPIAAFEYENGWFPLTDGTGFSLTLRDTAVETHLLDLKQTWKASSRYGGTPGAPDGLEVPAPGAIVINEVLSHTDASPDGDWIELLNSTAAPIALDGWWLSDSEGSPYKFRIPTNTVLGPGAFVVFNASNHFQNAANGTNAFGLSELGEAVVLSSAHDAQGRPTGYREVETFGAQEREVSFGRHIKSSGKSDFVAQRALTRGAPNAGPRVGPVVVSEIHHRPATNRVEFIELYNITASNVPLYESTAPAHTWRLANAVTYAFPTGAVLQPFSSLIVCATNPAAFRALSGVSTNHPVYGPFTGALNNAGDDVELHKAIEPDLTNLPFAVADRVNYQEEAPWPDLTVTGRSIERVALNLYGNEPLNWRLGTATNGTPGPTLTADTDLDGAPDRWEQPNGLDPADAADAATDADNDGLTALEEFIAGTDPNVPDDGLRVGIVIDATNSAPVVTLQLRPATGAGYETFDRYYALEQADDIATNWSGVTAATNIAAGSGTYLHGASATGPLHFRARVRLQAK